MSSSSPVQIMDEDDIKLPKYRESLGFKPQSEAVVNKFLPYVNRLDGESQEVLKNIKLYLPKAILLNDIKPGVLHWAIKLSRYIELYGYKFSKEDHISFIKLFFELIMMPAIEPNLLSSFCNILAKLLLKYKLLTTEDLELPWRPLFDLYYTTSSWATAGKILIPSGLLRAIKNVIRLSRRYFSPESTQEMLDEWRPLMCPYNNMMMKAMIYFELFLPTNLYPEHHDKGFRLWFPEFMSIWEGSPNRLSWEVKLIKIIVRLAYSNIGYIDWTPYIPMIFTRILRDFYLPVGSLKVYSRPGWGFRKYLIETWIVSMMGGSSSCQKSITELFKALETYFHPSNIGRWTMPLYNVLSKLTEMLVKRVCRERFPRKHIANVIPDSHKLTEQELIAFTESLKPCIMLAMFSKLGSADASNTLRHLSTLCPHLVIPDVLDKLYPALETLTEPHRLTATLGCIVAVGPELVRGGSGYPQGQTHVVPLLMLSLPGIDPNDPRKCMGTFQFILNFCALVELVDCSEAVSHRSDLTELEKEVCFSTAQFEDFVVEFLGRCFHLIQSSVLDQVANSDSEAANMNSEEGMLEQGVASTFTVILHRSSPSIYMTALKKLHTFVSGTILETKISGKYAASMVRAAVVVNTEAALKMFLPGICNTITSLAKNEGILKEETLDDELSFNLLLLSEVMVGNGHSLLPYKEQLQQVFEVIIDITSKVGSRLAAKTLKNLSYYLSATYVLKYQGMRLNEQKPLSEYLPIRNWGSKADFNDVVVQWHIPNPEELKWVSELLHVIIKPRLQELNEFADGKLSMSRETLNRKLNLVNNFIVGASAILPIWKDRPVHLVDCTVPMVYEAPVFSDNDQCISLDGNNVRLEILNLMNKIIAHLLGNLEDEATSFNAVILIYQSLLLQFGIKAELYEKDLKRHTIAKMNFSNKLAGKKRHLKTLLVDRIGLKHQDRSLRQNYYPLTECTKELMNTLLTLATSRYSAVRIRSQFLLGKCFFVFPYSQAILLDQLLEIIGKDPATNHEQFKGALHVLLSKKDKSFFMHKDWKVTSRVWTAMINMKLSEKPSIINLLEECRDYLYKKFVTLSIHFEMTNSCMEVAKNIFGAKTVPCSDDNIPSTDTIAEFQTKVQEKNQEKLELYRNLVRDITSLMENNNLHWRYFSMAAEMLHLLIRFDMPLPAPTVDILFNLLVHDSLALRKSAIESCSFIFKQQKFAAATTHVDPKEVRAFNYDLSVEDELGLSGISDCNNTFGYRQDNLWILYNKNHQPNTIEKFNNYMFVHKSHWGYHSWPKKLNVYCQKQSFYHPETKNMPKHVQVIYDTLSNQDFIDKLIKYHSLEERKGIDKLDNKKCYLFKGIFRNFRCQFLPQFKDHLLNLVTSSAESKQRCAAEIVCGILKGSKHWNFEEMESLKEFIVPVINLAFLNVSNETKNDWAVCIAGCLEHRDPNKYYWLLEMLLENPLNGNKGSFLVSCRLHIMFCGLVQHEWRIPEVMHRLMKSLVPGLTDSSKTVRDKISCILTQIFLTDNMIKNSSRKLGPKLGDFINEILPKLDSLNQNGIKASPNFSASSQELDTVNGALQQDEVLKGKNLLKAVCQMLVMMIGRSHGSIPPSIFQFLPLVCQYESDISDNELRILCAQTLGGIGLSFMLPAALEAALEAMQKTVQSKSWHCRNAVTEILKIMVFYNYFTLKNNIVWLNTITAMVCDRFKDDRVEVRENASVVLSGFMQCGFLDISHTLIENFRRMCSLKKPKKTLTPAQLLEVHAGVLGLSAIVNAHPYDVPQYIPDILMVLGDHLNHPQPILSTVKKTLSNFKRTHHDSWRDHKLKFSDDQLVILTDLLVSPNYYA